MIPLSDDTQLSLVLSGTVDSPRFKNAVIYILLPFCPVQVKTGIGSQWNGR